MSLAVAGLCVAQILARDVRPAVGFFYFCICLAIADRVMRTRTFAWRKVFVPFLSYLCGRPQLMCLLFSVRPSMLNILFCHRASSCLDFDGQSNSRGSMMFTFFLSSAILPIVVPHVMKMSTFA